jgi:Heat shock factor binding protein 1.
MSEHRKDDSGEKELNAFVQSLLKQMQDRFEEMSSSIVNRIDEMGNIATSFFHSGRKKNR